MTSRTTVDVYRVCTAGVTIEASNLETLLNFRWKIRKVLSVRRRLYANARSCRFSNNYLWTFIVISGRVFTDAIRTMLSLIIIIVFRFPSRRVYFVWCLRESRFRGFVSNDRPWNDRRTTLTLVVVVFIRSIVGRGFERLFVTINYQRAERGRRVTFTRHHVGRSLERITSIKRRNGHVIYKITKSVLNIYSFPPSSNGDTPSGQHTDIVSHRIGNEHIVICSIRPIRCLRREYCPAS